MNDWMLALRSIVFTLGKVGLKGFDLQYLFIITVRYSSYHDYQLHSL